MALVKYYGRKVKITASDDHVFFGTVTEYVYPEDNESEKESIIDSVDGDLIEFYEEDIKEIIEIEGA